MAVLHRFYCLYDNEDLNLIYLLLALCLLGNFSPVFCCLPIFFQNELFRKILSGKPSECQAAWIQLMPYIMSGLIWVQTVCKGYQQVTLLDKELKMKYLLQNILSLRRFWAQLSIPPCLFGFLHTGLDF